MSGPLCANCGELPSEHRVRNERLKCPDITDSEWAWKKQDRLDRINEELRHLQAKEQRLLRERTELLVG